MALRALVLPHSAWRCLTKVEKAENPDFIADSYSMRSSLTSLATRNADSVVSSTIPSSGSAGRKDNPP